MSAFKTGHPWAIGVTTLPIGSVSFQSLETGEFIGGAVSDAEQAMSCNWNSQYQMFSANGRWLFAPNTPDIPPTGPGPNNGDPASGWVKGASETVWSIPYSAGLGFASNQAQVPGPSFTLGRTPADLGHDEVTTSDWMILGELAALPEGEPNSGQAEWYQVQGRVRIEAWFSLYQYKTVTGFSRMAVNPYWWCPGKIIVETQTRLNGGGHKTGRLAPLESRSPSTWVQEAIPTSMQDPADLELNGYDARYVTLELPGSPDDGYGPGPAALTQVAILPNRPYTGPGMTGAYFDVSEFKISCLTPFSRRADL